MSKPYHRNDLTLGDLLGSDDVTIKRNAMSILKVLTNCDHHYEEGRCIYCFKPRSKCKHDWDAYGKCCICGKWDIEATRH